VCITVTKVRQDQLTREIKNQLQAISFSFFFNHLKHSLSLSTREIIKTIFFLVFIFQLFSVFFFFPSR
jgi:hypothetical protein